MTFRRQGPFADKCLRVDPMSLLVGAKLHSDPEWFPKKPDFGFTFVVCDLRNLPAIMVLKLQEG